jgi:hypothetical protein
MSHRPSSKDAITGSIPSATTFKSRDIICLQIGIWQGCQISRLFYEDAQDAQGAQGAQGAQVII